MLVLKYCVYQRRSAIAGISKTDRPLGFPRQSIVAIMTEPSTNNRIVSQPRISLETYLPNKQTPFESNFV